MKYKIIFNFETYYVLIGNKNHVYSTFFLISPIWNIHKEYILIIKKSNYIKFFKILKFLNFPE